jgi:FAD/FMN-containing dehydrogenase
LRRTRRRGIVRFMGPAGFRGVWREDAAARAVYSESAGIERVLPRAVAVPDDADDVAALVRWATGHGTPLIPRGAGSSMAGGATGPGVVMDLSRMRRLDPVDVAWKRVRCDPGVTQARVNHAASAAGLRLPVDPSSAAFCTVGGMAATNAAGARSLRFGTMRNWVSALDCVFADGSRAELRRGSAPPRTNPTLARLFQLESGFRERIARITRPAVRKNSSGYAIHHFLDSGDPIDLVIGSEGTLAVIVGLELRLAALPIAEASLFAVWNVLEACVRGSALAREAGAAACELLDQTFLELAASRTRVNIPPGSQAVLLIALEHGEADAEDALSDAAARERAQSAVAARGEALRRAFEAAGATQVLVALDPETAEGLWSLRHAASPTLARLDPSLKSMQLVEDGCVPEGELATYVRGLRDRLHRHGIRGVLFGHAGEAHVHANALIDVSEPDWRSRAEQLFEDVVALIASLGGTLAGEHGDGRLRTPVLDRVWAPEARALFAEIKQAFDPAGLLNPGVKVPIGRQSMLGAVKYDLALPPLPMAARRVLDLVAEERAYDRSRLELLDSVDMVAGR